MSTPSLLAISLWSGVLLNFAGAARLLFEGLRAVAAAEAGAEERLLYKLFTSGTAAVFGTLYLYLVFHPDLVWPFLLFGAALKTWACLVALHLYWRGRLGRRLLLEFGISNGVVAALFWICIANAAQ
jgi:hypothetical protein